jgi:7-cyano-7-deazaguanine synthase in queuosine biosynthesis
MYTQGPWRLGEWKGHKVEVNGPGWDSLACVYRGSQDPKQRVAGEHNAAIIALAPEMAEFLSRMRCCYKAPEVADEMCGHCIVCKAKLLSVR